MTGAVARTHHLQLLREGGTLKVTRLDRLSRSVLHLVTPGADLRGHGIELHAIEQSIDTLPDGWDSIPGARGCTAETCGFRDHHQDLIAAGATQVYGLSSQDSDYQREVTERLRLPFQMLSDPARSLARALGLPTFTAGGLTLYKRITLIIQDDVIEHAFYPVFPPDEHAEQVLTWLSDNAHRP